MTRNDQIGERPFLKSMLNFHHFRTQGKSFGKIYFWNIPVPTLQVLKVTEKPFLESMQTVHNFRTQTTSFSQIFSKSELI